MHIPRDLVDALVVVEAEHCLFVELLRGEDRAGLVLGVAQYLPRLARP